MNINKYFIDILRMIGELAETVTATMDFLNQ